MGKGARAALPWDLERGAALERAVADLEISEEEHDPREVLAGLGKAGILRECVPREHGGAADVVEVRALCVLRRALAYRSPLFDLMFGVQGLGSYPVTLHGSAEQKARLLPAIASGAAIGAFAITEPEAGSDLSAIRTRARRSPDGTGHLLSGEKTFVSNAGLATSYVLFARTSDDERAGLTAFLVPAQARGIEVVPQRLISGDHPIGRLVLRDVFVPHTAIIGEEGEGLRVALSTLGTFRATVGAAAVGMGRRALDEALRHARERVLFGRPLGELQATQMALAEMKTSLEAASLLVERAAWLIDSGERAASESSMAKLFATETAQEIIDRALQLHGGSGLLAGSVIERLYREVRALRIYEGTSEIQKLIIARELLRG